MDIFCDCEECYFDETDDGPVLVCPLCGATYPVNGDDMSDLGFEK